MKGLMVGVTHSCDIFCAHPNKGHILLLSVIICNNFEVQYANSNLSIALLGKNQNFFTENRYAVYL